MPLRQMTIDDYMERPKSKETERNPNIKLPEDFELTQEFTDTFNLIENTNNNVYVTGEAGTGKSTFLKYFVKHTKKKVVILSSTGVGAMNVDGQTIHSFFQFPLKPLRKADIVKLSVNRRDFFNTLDAIVIDEVSMVRADLMDAIDYCLRLNLDCLKTPFGGIQIILIGDMYQLPPVEDKDMKVAEVMNYKTCYFFDAHVFGDAEVVYTELKHQYRQKDSRLLEILNNIRAKNIKDKDLSILNQRVTTSEVSGNPIVLTMTNAVAGEINREELSKLDTEEYHFEAEIWGDFYSDRSYPTDKTLVLKEGAQVMMLRNDQFRSWVNGTIAVVEKLTTDSIEVRIGDNVYSVPKVKWERKKYGFNSETNRIEQYVVGYFEQYPLKLAWAITVHKSQGQTFDTVVIARGKGAFAHGQMYVGLSRCRTLDGIHLLHPIEHRDFILDHRVDGYKDKFQKHTQGL